MRLALALACAAATPALAAPCGGDFAAFRDAMAAEAIAAGHPEDTTRAFFDTLRQDPRVLAADRRQGVFQLDFITFSRRLISQDRIDRGRANLRRHAAIFDRIAQDSGVPAGILAAFWAFETDYGQVQGDFLTADALATLAHDCRRPDLFQPQLLAALTLYERGELDPDQTQGAWAGEIGMVQMLPADILRHGTDADGDGRVSLKTSIPDALVSGGRMLAGLGWRAGQPWLQEVTVPAGLDWSLAATDRRLPVAEWQRLGVAPREGTLAEGLDAALLLPVGHKGPAFLAYPNFDVLFEWNQSYVYVLTAAYFATRLEGATVYDAGSPDPGLDEAAMKALQTALQARGHDVGKVDGILGLATRTATRNEQVRLGLPADGWPTAALLRALRG
jgi:lytic murein transglycosylase